MTSKNFTCGIVCSRLYNKHVMKVDVTPRNSMLLLDLNDLQHEISNKYKDREYITTATEIDVIVYHEDGSQDTEKISIREQDSIFDQMTKCVESNKWGVVYLRGLHINLCLKEDHAYRASTRKTRSIVPVERRFFVAL